jgi:Fe-S-cluster containining protein
MVNKCSGCGVCCKLFLINLSKKEFKSNKYKTQFKRLGAMTFAKAESCGANILEQKEDGSCFYLKDTKCSIHKTRPEACKAFFCSSKSKAFKEMIKDINKSKLQ